MRSLAIYLLHVAQHDRSMFTKAGHRVWQCQLCRTSASWLASSHSTVSSTAFSMVALSAGSILDATCRAAHHQIRRRTEGMP